MEYSDLNIVNLLTNSGLTVIGMDNDFLYLEDPSCIFPVFDTILNYAWIVILVLTAFMLLGWGVLYIKNGVKVDDLFKNASKLAKLNDIFEVRPGEVIPLDGIIIKGSTALNTASITVEPKLSNIVVGDEVLSGSINVEGLLEVQVTEEYENSTVNKETEEYYEDCIRFQKQLPYLGLNCEELFETEKQKKNISVRSLDEPIESNIES